MPRFSLTTGSVFTSPEKVTQATVQRVSVRTGVSSDIVRVFAKLSDPAKGNLFSAKAAHKAFAHLKSRPAR